MVGADESPAALWARLLAWLEVHAPRSRDVVQEPTAPPSDLEEMLGYPLGQELREYFAAVGGARRVDEGRLLPACCRPFGVLEAQAEIRLLRRVFATHPSDLVQAARRQPAGGGGFAYLSEFVPLADDFSGNWLFADLRRGPEHGCVQFFDHEQGVEVPAYWSGPRAMLGQLVAAVEAGAPWGRWQPLVDREALVWRFTATGSDRLRPRSDPRDQ